MSPAGHETLTLHGQEIEMLTELLEEARTKLLVEIRHTDHRVFRDELRARLERMEALLQRSRKT
jgi:hypothetical protein